MKCDCEMFEEGCRHINGFIHMAVLHHMQPFNEKYQMVYCPWCGTKLEQDEEKE